MQVYDVLDLNVRCVVDEIFYFIKGFLYLIYIEVLYIIIVKIVDNNIFVIGCMFKVGMQKVVWDVCEIFVGNFFFWCKFYYGKFLIFFIFDEKFDIFVFFWDDIIFNQFVV